MIGASIIVVLAIGIAGLVAARRNVRETTLTATWWWSFASFIISASVDLLALWQLLPDDATIAALRYAARVLLLCPTVSLIGAKRPQDGPWNFVVVSLWGVLALPAAEALLLNNGQPLEIQGFRAWFLLGLIFVTLVNTLPTRHWLAALLAVAGQALLLADYLPFPFAVSPAVQSCGGFASLAASAVVFAAPSPRTSPATSLDQLWLDFRDSFGFFWALRVQERINAAATMYHWPVALRWTGWTRLDGQPLGEPLSPDEHRAIMATFRGLLRRFVSNEWIDAR